LYVVLRFDKRRRPSEITRPAKKAALEGCVNTSTSARRRPLRVGFGATLIAIKRHKKPVYTPEALH
jgi:hypothetical protein